MAALVEPSTGGSRSRSALADKALTTATLAFLSDAITWKLQMHQEVIMASGSTITEATRQDVAHYIHKQGVSLISALQFLHGEPVLDCDGWVHVTQMMMGGSMVTSRSTQLVALESLKRLGVSAIGAQQFVSGQTVTAATDRTRLAQIAIGSFVAGGNLTTWVDQLGGVGHEDNWDVQM